MFTNEKKELTVAEYRRLLACAKGTRLELVMQTICETGVRVSELEYITVEALNRGKAVVECKNKTRVIFIPVSLKCKLLSYVKKKKIVNGPVFVTQTGKPLNRSNIWREMKDKKKVFVVAVAVCLVATISMGTLAWFSASDEVTNNFMIADSADTPDEIFSVDVWEYVNGNTENKDQDGHTYENILPGGRYHKEPYVENTDSYDQYIRVKVTVNNADAWIAALGNGYDLGTMFEGHDESAWTRYEVGEYNAQNNTYTMVFYLNYKLAPGATACLINTVAIPSQLTQEDMVFIGGQFELTILAEAVQTEHVGDNAYEAFQTVGME